MAKILVMHTANSGLIPAPNLQVPSGVSPARCNRSKTKIFIRHWTSGQRDEILGPGMSVNLRTRKGLGLNLDLPAGQKYGGGKES